MNYLPDWGFLCGWRCARISIGWMDLLICWIFFVFFIILFFFFLFSFHFFWLPWMHVKGGTLWMKTNWKLMLEEEKRLQKDFSAGIVGFLFFFSFLNFVFCNCSTNSDFHHSMMKISWIFFPFLVFLFYFFYFNNFDLIFIHFFSSFHLAQAMVSTKKVMFTSPSLGWASCPLQLP